MANYEYAQNVPGGVRFEVVELNAVFLELTRPIIPAAWQQV